MWYSCAYSNLHSRMHGRLDRQQNRCGHICQSWRSTVSRCRVYSGAPGQASFTTILMEGNLYFLAPVVWTMVTTSVILATMTIFTLLIRRIRGAVVHVRIISNCNVFLGRSCRSRSLCGFEICLSKVGAYWRSPITTGEWPVAFKVNWESYCLKILR